MSCWMKNNGVYEERRADEKNKTNVPLHGNVGEGMIAKRRSYAGLQSYLTPPFMESNAGSDDQWARR